MTSRLLAILTLVSCYSLVAADEKNLKDLLEARYNRARQGAVTAAQEFREGRASVDDVVTWSKRVLQSGLEFLEADTSVGLYEGHLNRMKNLETEAESRKENISSLQMAAARYAKAEAEVELAKVRARVKKK